MLATDRARGGPGEALQSWLVLARSAAAHCSARDPRDARGARPVRPRKRLTPAASPPRPAPPPPRGGGRPEAAARPAGSPRFPADLLGPARPQPGHPGQRVRGTVRAAWAQADVLFTVRASAGRNGCGQILALLGRPQEMKGLEWRMEYDLRDARDGARRPEEWTFRILRRGRHLHGGGAAPVLRRGLPFPRGGIALRTSVARRPRASLDPTSATTAASTATSCPSRPSSAVARAPSTCWRHRDPTSRWRPRRSSSCAGRRARPSWRVSPDSLPRPPARRPPCASRWPSGPPTRADKPGERRVGELRGPLPTARPWRPGGVPEAGRHQVTVAGVPARHLPGLGEHARSGGSRLGGATLVASPLVVYPDETTHAAQTAIPGDARDPFASFQVGAMRLRPRFGNVFTARTRSGSWRRCTGPGWIPSPVRLPCAPASASSRTASRSLAVRRTRSRRPMPCLGRTDPPVDLRSRSVRGPPGRDGRAGQPDAPPGGPVRDPDAVSPPAIVSPFSSSTGDRRRLAPGDALDRPPREAVHRTIENSVPINSAEYSSFRLHE